MRQWEVWLGSLANLSKAKRKSFWLGIIVANELDFSGAPDVSVHEKIRQTQDRSHTAALLKNVMTGDSSSENWSICLETLRWLEDYRTVDPLRAYIQDISHSEGLRCAVSQALASFDLTTTSAQRRSWWESTNPALREYALRLMQEPEGDLVIEVAAQDGHPLQAVAIATLSMGFEAPTFQLTKVSCLSSQRPDVLLAAVSSIIWDEPLSAEPVLRQLLSCGTEEVECRAADALQYYGSTAALSSLRQRSSDSMSEALTGQVAASIDFLEGTIESELTRCGPAARSQLSQWAAEVGHLRELPADQQSTRRAKKPTVPFSEEVFAAALKTNSGPTSQSTGALRAIDWDSVQPGHQNNVVERLANHADPEIRMIASKPLAIWNETSRLLELAVDEHALVRKLALFALAKVPADPEVAAFTYALIADLPGPDMTDALSAFSAHADPHQRQRVLFDLAMRDSRFGVRHSAIALLDDSPADVDLKPLLDILGEPPLVNWAVHTAVLATRASQFANRADLEYLMTIDNIHVAAAAARALN